MFTFGPIDGVLCQSLACHTDSRGWLIECYRDDELPAENRPRMTYVSETLPGISRGPHEHLEQADYFAFVGPGDFKIYLWDMRPDSPTYRRRTTILAGESNRLGVIVPPGVVHAYKNVSAVPAWVINCPNRLYKGEGKREPVDETRHEHLANSPFVLD